MATVVTGDLERVPDPWVLVVYLPSCARMDVGLWTGWRWGLVFLILFPRDSRRLHDNVALNQRVDDLFEWGRRIGRVDLEELGR